MPDAVPLGAMKHVRPKNFRREGVLSCQHVKARDERVGSSQRFSPKKDLLIESRR